MPSAPPRQTKSVCIIVYRGSAEGHIVPMLVDVALVNEPVENMEEKLRIIFFAGCIATWLLSNKVGSCLVVTER